MHRSYEIKMGLNNKSGITPWLRANGSRSQSLAKIKCH
ncbi:hypothetical protein SynROS8604_00222 [Synechococcus sp. ROS8604]|nr:hypothetical protein SynROS8604_00222 [Synechococcus sp. ROS8604]